MKYSAFSIFVNESLITALKRMDQVDKKLLMVFDSDLFVGLLSLGTIQRAIINNINLNTPVKQIVRKDGIVATSRDSIDDIKKMMFKYRMEYMPVIEQGKLLSIYFWNDFFQDEMVASERTLIDLPVVIMAGGKGSRLKPLTNVIPKPLIPIGEKTILESILDQFEAIGSKRFYMSVNYKYDILKYYLDHLEHQYCIEFFREEKPLGTIGSVSLLKNKITTPFFVSNCDIVIDQDFRDVYEYHQENGNEITIVTAVKNFKIPYGVIETGENGLIVALTEKPDLTYMINTGVYMLNPEVIDEIPQNEFYHITDLIEKVRVRGGKVGCFPVTEKAWTDMGDWNEYLKLIKIEL